MNSVILSVQTLDTINDILNEFTGYGSDRKVNYEIELSEEEGGGNFKLVLIYNDTGKIVFEGTIKQENYIEAVKSEEIKEKESRKDCS